jgi:hypothetical protein
MSDLDLHLKLPEPIRINKNISRELDKLEEKTGNIFPFKSIQPVQVLFNLFLIKKYKSNCIILGKRFNPHSTIGLYISLKIRYTKKEETEMRYDFSHISNQIIECVKKGSNTIIIPLFYDGRKWAHQNVLIYRKNLAQLEHFEPHGYAVENNIKMQISVSNNLLLFTDILNSKLKSNGFQEVTFIDASQVCPYIEGLQSLEAKSQLRKKKLDGVGYCAAWSMFFSELCLKNPEISSSEIMNNIYNYLSTKSSAEDYLLKVIRGYAGYILENVNTYLEIFFKPKITFFDILDIYKNAREDELIDFKFNKIKRVLEILVNIEARALLDPDFNLKKELKQVSQQYKEKTKGMTKEQIKIARHRTYLLSEIYYTKRILQNYEEYNKHGKITEPIFDSLDEIREEEIVNTNVTKRIPFQLKKQVKSVKVKKTFPKTKTQRKK